jgi:hypothetical protein
MVRFGKPDGLVFVTPDAGFAVLVFSHDDVEGGFWTRSWLTSPVLLPLANFQIFRPAHTRLSLFSYDELLALGLLGLRWLNQDLLPLELDYVQVNLEWIFVVLHLGFSANSNSPSFMTD